MDQGAAGAGGAAAPAGPAARDLAGGGAAGLQRAAAGRGVVPQERERAVPAARRHLARPALREHPEPAAGAQAQRHHHDGPGAHPGQQAHQAPHRVHPGA